MTSFSLSTSLTSAKNSLRRKSSSALVLLSPIADFFCLITHSSLSINFNWLFLMAISRARTRAEKKQSRNRAGRLAGSIYRFGPWIQVGSKLVHVSYSVKVFMDWPCRHLKSLGLGLAGFILLFNIKTLTKFVLIL